MSFRNKMEFIWVMSRLIFSKDNILLTVRREDGEVQEVWTDEDGMHSNRKFELILEFKENK